jgi:hypothetical protein
MIRFFSDKRTNSTNECLEIFLGTKLKIFPKNPFYKLPAMKKKGKKIGSVQLAKRRKCEKRAFVIFHGNYLKKKSVS